jgi:inhibitor of KinA sporulation pathway (predicted exonuclease)
MAQKLDQILVIDVEATCWAGNPPPGQEAEIIEIGICVLDVASGDRLRTESVLVRPQRSTVSPFCTQLTTLTQAQVDTGVSFQAACAILKKKYLSKKRLWASYGDYDRRQFERQCQDWDIPYPCGATHLNVKNLFAIRHRLSKEVGLDKALTLLNRPLEVTHHRGDDDAWNIAGVLSTLLFSS